MLHVQESAPKHVRSMKLNRVSIPSSCNSLLGRFLNIQCKSNQCITDEEHTQVWLWEPQQTMVYDMCHFIGMKVKLQNSRFTLCRCNLHRFWQKLMDILHTTVHFNLFTIILISSQGTPIPWQIQKDFMRDILVYRIWTCHFLQNSWDSIVQ